MRLEVKDPKKMLVIRMQAWAYENVIGKDYPKAERTAATILRRFEDQMEANPCDEAGYWAGFYFEQFKEACGD